MKTVFRRLQAKWDVLTHVDFLAQDNLDAAERFLDAVDATFSELARFPELGWLWEPPLKKYPGLRCCLVKDFQNHLVFYRVKEEALDILRVLHGSRNLPKLLSEE